MQLMKLVEEVVSQPPLKFDPERQSLKAWAVYCLRDRGFKIVYAQNADFAIETRTGEKIYFKVTEDDTNLDDSVAWVVRDRSTNHIRVIAPQSNAN